MLETSKKFCFRIPFNQSFKNYSAGFFFSENYPKILSNSYKNSFKKSFFKYISKTPFEVSLLISSNIFLRKPFMNSLIDYLKKILQWFVGNFFIRDCYRNLFTNLFRNYFRDSTRNSPRNSFKDLPRIHNGIFFKGQGIPPKISHRIKIMH